MEEPPRMSLSTVMAKLHDAAEGDRVTFGDVLEAFGSRAYGPLLFVLGLLVLSPLGAIPGVTILAGSIMTVLVVQMLAGGTAAPWIPGFLGRIGMDGARARRSIDWADGKVRVLDRLVGPRWEWATGPWPVRLSACAIVLLAATFVPLALVPWGVVPPAIAITLLALALFTRDGLVLLAGLAATAATLAVGLNFLL